ncbi:prolipoprotein diacylglyceryl transferase [Candidatus Woesearchaeota archaeon]|nr:prolipoprotein diacylglyceryl transferase [Candidatus Woesearchaeota archaeon]
MWSFQIDPVLFHVGFLEVRYYGIIYAFGFLLALYFLMKARHKIGLSKDDTYDLVFYLMIGDVVGARLFHVLFWEPAYYFANPLKILYVWEGGLAFHGGLVGLLIAGYWFSKKKNFSFLKMADVLTVPALIGLAFGRIANFINGELVGTMTTVSWCVNTGDDLCRHPYVLYSAAKRFAIAGLIFFLQKKDEYKEGFLFLLMLLLLGIGRFFLDYMREDVRYFSLSMGQWMSLVMFLIAGVLLLKNYRLDLRKIFKGFFFV